MEISQCMKASILEEANIETIDDPRPISIAKELKLIDKVAMIMLLKDYYDVFTRSHRDMKGIAT